MSPTRSRTSGVAMAVLVALSAFALGAPVAAADSPEAAINDLFDIVESGDLSGLDALVCEAERANVRELFDVQGQLGVDEAASGLDALSIEVTDRSVDIISQDADTATARVTATLTLSIEDDELEGFVRAALEADLGPDDPPVSDEDVAFMVPFMSSALNTSLPIDEELGFVVEDGEWLVCGGLGVVSEPDRIGSEPEVSFDGLCGLVSIEELNSLSSLVYDSSSGFETFCTYSQSNLETFHSATLSFDEGQDLDTVKSIFGVDQELVVVGSPAFASGFQVFVQVGEDLLQVALALPEDVPPDVDLVTHATHIAELVIPALPDFKEMRTGPTTAPTPLPTPEISLCESFPLDELNDVSGLGLDDATGDSYSCNYSSDGDPAWHFITAVVIELPLDEYREFLPEPVDTTVAGQPALTSSGTLVVGLPDGTRSLQVALGLDTSAGPLPISADDLAVVIAERLLPGIAPDGS